MSEQISEQRLKAIVEWKDAKYTAGRGVSFDDCTEMAEELIALRTAAEGMQKELERAWKVVHVSHDPPDRDQCTWPICRDIRASLATYRKAVGR